MKDKQGDLVQAGVPMLLHLIYSKGDECAILDVVREPVRKRFFFRNGIPVAASSNILNEVLGRLLMQEGIITQKQYEGSLEIVLRDKKRHGEVLIGMGLLTPGQLEDFLRLQLKRRLFKLFDWSEGSYRYIKADSIPQNLSNQPLHPASLILEGISLGFYPVSRIKTDLKDWLDKNVKASGSARYKPDDFHLNLQEKRFLESLDGSKTLKEALESSDLLRHRALSLALSFIITGLVSDEEGAKEPDYTLEEMKETHSVEAPVDSKLNAELLFMRAKSALQKKDFKGSIEILREITNLSPSEGEYWAYLGWAVYNDDPANIKEAEKIIKDSIDLNNDLDAAWFYLGMLFLASGNTPWARKAFSTAIEKNPWNLEALAELKRLEVREKLGDGGRKGWPAQSGFTADPFSNAPEAGQISLTEGQAKALESVTRAVKKKTVPVLLEGGNGVGKTTVVLELLKRLSNEKVLCACILRPAEKELALIKEINTEIGSQSDSAAIKEQLLSLGMRVSQNKIQGGHTLLIIDEAHTLTDGCLKLIQYLSRLKTVQILLSADKSLSERLKSPDYKELDEKMTARAALDPMSAEEARAYMLQRLSSAPKKDDPSLPVSSLSGEEMDAIFEASNGYPSAINREASNLLRSSAETRAAEAERGGKEAVFEITDTRSSEEREDASVGAAPFREEFVIEAGQTERPAEAGPVLLPPSHEISAQEKKETVSEQPSFAQKPVPQSEGAAKEETLSFSTAAAEKPGKAGLLKLVFWIIIMLVAGLVAGSLIGTFWFSEEPPEQTQPPVTAPAGPALNPEPAALPDTSLDSAPIDGSINEGALR